MGETMIPDNNSFVVAARRMMNRGELTLEQYANVQRRALIRQ